MEKLKEILEENLEEYGFEINKRDDYIYVSIEDDLFLHSSVLSCESLV